jgi:6-phosphofructokinase 1
MLIVVAEGAGQELMARGEGRMSMDPSGNVKLQDIGVYFCNVIRAEFARAQRPVAIRYIDPSYIIRAAPANASDNIYCAELAERAVHAAMSGRTDMVVGSWGGRLTHVPLELATSGRKTVDLEGPLWLSVLEATGQPLVMKN